MENEAAEEGTMEERRRLSTTTAAAATTTDVGKSRQGTAAAMSYGGRGALYGVHHGGLTAVYLRWLRNADEKGGRESCS